LRHPRLGAALRFENDAILFDDFEVLLFPERLIEKSPIRPPPSCEIPVSQKIDQRVVFIDRRGETENPQNAFRSEWKRNVETNPGGILAIKLRPIEVHSSLAFTFDDKTVRVARRQNVVFDGAARKRE